MDKKKFTKTSLIAVSAVALTGLAFATPSFAAPHKTGSVASVQAKGHGHNHGMESGKKMPESSPSSEEVL